MYKFICFCRVQDFMMFADSSSWTERVEGINVAVWFGHSVAFLGRIQDGVVWCGAWSTLVYWTPRRFFV